ncbi:MAG: PepSY domain-containing protein [Nitrospira sp.]
MAWRILNILMVVSFVGALGCELTTHLRFPACRERVKLQNSPLGIASRVAAIKVSGTPVQAKEIKKNGHSVYQVVMQAASGKPRSVDIDPQMVAEAQLAEPVSSAQCKALEDQDGKEAFPIATAIQLAEEQLNGTAQEAAFELRDGVYGYVVTVADAKGQQYRALVDATAKTIIMQEKIK